jgi:Cft2 family RNA processing exonuclease
MDFTSAAELLAIDGHTHAHLDCTSAAELLAAGGRTNTYVNFTSPAIVLFAVLFQIVITLAAYAIAAQ